MGFTTRLASAAALAVLCGSLAVAEDYETLSDAELAQLFAVFDANDNGVITRPELRGVITSFRVDLGEDDLDHIVLAYDHNADGLLQEQEFADLMQGFRKEDTSLEAEMERVFLRFDSNRDGGLDAREVRQLMEASGQTITLREAKEIVLEADDDGNGRIDTGEFGATPG